MVAETANIATTNPVPSAADAKPGRWFRLRREIVRCWYCVRQFGLVLWIVRVPLTTTALGLLILIFAPQAQDLFVEFARTSFWWMLYFMFVLVALWAIPTHYAARLLLETDARLQKRLQKERNLKNELKQKRKNGLPIEDWEAGFATCIKTSCVFVPRALGILTFVAVLSAILRSYLNLPDLSQKEVTAAVDWALVKIAILVIVGLIGFLLYVFHRPKHARLPLPSKHKGAKALARFWRTASPGEPFSVPRCALCLPRRAKRPAYAKASAG